MLRALGSTSPWAPLAGSPCSFTRQQKEEEEGCRVTSDGWMGARGEGAGLYAAACSKGWIFYCLLLYG